MLTVEHPHLRVVAWFAGSYLYHGLGITLGYHRLLAHRALRLPKLLERAIVLGGYLALQGSPMVWVGVHRLHHWKPDREGDPHSPQDGVFHALITWMFKAHRLQSTEELRQVTDDLTRDNLYRFLGSEHNLSQVIVCLFICVFSRVALFWSCGGDAVIGNVSATFTVLCMTLFVNVGCHVQAPGAYRNFDTCDNSSNFWVLGLLALGEGWHNNHHASPGCARHGKYAIEFDATWYAIRLLEVLGLAQRVRRQDLAKPLPPHSVTYWDGTDR
jgi:sn-1 stearoyl-lipid 9-desaturase